MQSSLTKIVKFYVCRSDGKTSPCFCLPFLCYSFIGMLSENHGSHFYAIIRRIYGNVSFLFYRRNRMVIENAGRAEGNWVNAEKGSLMRPKINEKVVPTGIFLFCTSLFRSLLVYSYHGRFLILLPS